MQDKGKTKGKHKRGECGSVEEDQQGSKRANMADAELQITSKVNNDEGLSGANEQETASKGSAEETNLLELKEMLVDIQITVSNILRENSKLANEVAELQNAFLQQIGELTNVKTALARCQKQQDDLEIQLAAARKKTTTKKRKSQNYTISKTHWNNILEKTHSKSTESRNPRTPQLRRLSLSSPRL